MISSLCSSMISAQMPSAFVARENQFSPGSRPEGVLFRIMRLALQSETVARLAPLVVAEPHRHSQVLVADGWVQQPPGRHMTYSISTYFRKNRGKRAVSLAAALAILLATPSFAQDAGVSGI